jgi:hypothetical protein
MTRQSVHRAALRRWHRDGTYDRLLAAQGGCCGICGAPEPDSRRLDIDHDHALKVPVARGLLCRGCNMQLPREYDSAKAFRAACYLAASEAMVAV